VVDLDLDQRRRLEVISKSGVETEKTAVAGDRDEPGNGDGGVIELEELSRFHSTYQDQDHDRERGQREERRKVLAERSLIPSYCVCCR
jgi:hypothetical protein